MLHKSQNSISCNSKSYSFVIQSFLISSDFLCELRNIEQGNHDDYFCEEYCQRYKNRFKQELPDCEFKGNKSKIQKLIKKVHIDENGIVTEVQFTSFSGGAPTQQQGPSFMPQTPQQ